VFEVCQNLSQMSRLTRLLSAGALEPFAELLFEVGGEGLDGEGPARRLERQRFEGRRVFGDVRPFFKKNIRRDRRSFIPCVGRDFASANTLRDSGRGLSSQWPSPCLR